MTACLALPPNITLTEHSADFSLATHVELETIFHGIIHVRDLTPWVIGDLLNEVASRKDDAKGEDQKRLEALESLAREHGHSGADLFEFRAVSSLIPADVRRPFSYTLHADIVAELQTKRALTPETLGHWLQWCDEDLMDGNGRRSRSKLRLAIRGKYESRGAEDTPPIPNVTTSLVRPFKVFRASLPSTLTAAAKREILGGLRPYVELHRELMETGIG
ncbi:hypothetical protein N9260_02315 [bacterium]|nr:hypothetical protein [bacterium]